MKYPILYFIILINTLLAFSCNAQEIYTQRNIPLRLHTDLPYISSENKLIQEVFYSTDTFTSDSLQLKCYLLGVKDSLLLYSKKNIKLTTKGGVSSIKAQVNLKDNNSYFLQPFYDILRKGDIIPCGNYKIVINAKKLPDTTFTFYYRVDSVLNPNSSIRKDMNSMLSDSRHPAISKKIRQVAGSMIPESATRKITKTFRSKGLDPVIHETGDKTIVDFYYKDWYVGRYTLNKKETLSQQLQRDNALASSPAGNLTEDDLENHQSVFSQFRKIKQEKKEKEEMTGDISVIGNAQNAQDPNADADNNYYEVQGNIEVPVFDMPVDISGFYTSQDAHRPVKASFISVHYNTDKAKQELADMMGAYNTKYSEIQSKGQGMDMIYQNYINNLQIQRNSLVSDIGSQSSLTPSGTDINTSSLQSSLKSTIPDTATMRSNTQASVDSGSGISNATKDGQKLKDGANADYQKIQEKENQVKELDKKIEKYQALLQQYKNTNYFDSAVAYDKMKDMNYSDASTYKQMANRASNILPDGKAKRFLSGITKFDAGMFPDYESKYTMSGQMMKGVSMGYDLGPVQTTFSVGKTEYVGSDGSLDKYTCYSAKVATAPFRNQKIDIIYYGYTPSRQMFAQDTFFKNVDAAMPGFRETVNIVSAGYNGTISKNIVVDGEVATSSKKSDSTGILQPQGDRMAYHLAANGQIPKTTVSLTASFDKTGKDFENNTLPLSLTGTDQYKVAAKGNFFKAKLGLGIEYDYMVQNNFAAKGSNTKWGFDIKYNSRRYPSVSLSYKPFSTFRSYSDTLNVPQHPLIGAVWTGRITYQIKKHTYALRFSLVYNRNTSIVDTANYSSTMLQFSTTYTTKKINAMVNVGTMKLTGTDASSLMMTPNNTVFTDLSLGYTLSKQLILTAGQDIGFSEFGLCRYATTAGVNYNFKKMPITTGVNLRYTNYQLTPYDAWQQLYGGDMSVTWHFKTKVSKDKK